MYKVAVLGSRDSIYGFAALGLEIFPVNAENGAKKLRELAESRYAVIYVTEELAAAIAPEIERYRLSKLPAIIPIPGVSGNNGIGIAQVKKSVEQAVGSDIIFNNNN